MKKTLKLMLTIVMIAGIGSGLYAQTGAGRMNKAGVDLLVSTINDLFSADTATGVNSKHFAALLSKDPTKRVDWINAYTVTEKLDSGAFEFYIPSGDDLEYRFVSDTSGVNIYYIKLGQLLPDPSYKNAIVYGWAFDPEMSNLDEKNNRPWITTFVEMKPKATGTAKAPTADQQPDATASVQTSTTAGQQPATGTAQANQVFYYTGKNGHQYMVTPSEQGPPITLDLSTGQVVGSTASTATAAKPDSTAKSASRTETVSVSGDQELLAQRVAYGQQAEQGEQKRRPASESFAEVDCKTCPGGKQKMVWDSEVNDWAPFGATAKTLKRNQALLDANQDVALLPRATEEHRMDDGRGLSVTPDSEHMADPEVQKWDNQKGTTVILGGGRGFYGNGNTVISNGIPAHLMHTDQARGNCNRCRPNTNEFGGFQIY